MICVCIHDTYSLYMSIPWSLNLLSCHGYVMAFAMPNSKPNVISLIDSSAFEKKRFELKLKKLQLKCLIVKLKQKMWRKSKFRSYVVFNCDTTPKFKLLDYVSTLEIKAITASDVEKKTYMKRIEDQEINYLNAFILIFSYFFVLLYGLRKQCTCRF